MVLQCRRFAHVDFGTIAPSRSRRARIIWKLWCYQVILVGNSVFVFYLLAAANRLTFSRILFYLEVDQKVFPLSPVLDKIWTRCRVIPLSTSKNEMFHADFLTFPPGLSPLHLAVCPHSSYSRVRTIEIVNFGLTLLLDVPPNLP